MTNRVRLAVLLIVPAFALVGCGGSDSSKDDVSGLSSDKLLATAKKQAASEEFVTVKGKGTDTKDKTELQVDLGFAGDTASGTIAVNGLELELLKAGGKAYFKASDEFYKSTAGDSADKVIKLIAGRWVVADPADSNFGEIASFVSKKDFFKELLDPDGKVTKAKDKTVNGIDCVGLTSDDSTFYFDKSDGKPVSLVTTDNGEGSLDFTYDKVDEAQAPDAADIVDLSKAGA